MERKGRRKKDTTNNLGLLVGVSLDAGIGQPKGWGSRAVKDLEQIAKGEGP